MLACVHFIFVMSGMNLHILKTIVEQKYEHSITILYGEEEEFKKGTVNSIGFFIT